MPSDSPRHPRIRGALAALALAAASLLVFAAPAAAHDELLSSDPAADAVAAALPPQLTLTFSAELLGDAGATQVQVTDAAGASITAGAPTVQANVVTQPLTAGASGAIAVIWRVVSSDGHPISGEYSFTVDAPPPTPTPSATASPTPSPSSSAEPSATAASPAPTAAASEGGATSEGGTTALPWILFGLVGAAVLGAVLYLLVSRVRRVRELDAARAAGVLSAGAATPQNPSAPGSDTGADR